MNNVMKIFEHPVFGNVRVVEHERQAWLVAKDVCDVLGHTNTTVAMQMLDEDERAKKSLGQVSANGVLQERETNIINEAGFYQLVIRSNLPLAKQFKRWVTHEVLPSIRKHKGYMQGQEQMSPDELMAKAVLYANSKIEEMQAKLAKQSEQIEEMKPKALFADAVSASDTSILVGELAKLLKQNGFDVGQNRLFEILRQKGYLMKGGSSRSLPTQKAMEKGLFEVKESTVVNADGSIRVTKTTKVTGKGQAYFINRFLRFEVA